MYKFDNSNERASEKLKYNHPRDILGRLKRLSGEDSYSKDRRLGAKISNSYRKSEGKPETRRPGSVNKKSFGESSHLDREYQKATAKKVRTDKDGTTYYDGKKDAVQHKNQKADYKKRLLAKRMANYGK
jgi:hypothetical protein